MRKILPIGLLLFSTHAFANICGSDYQTFNPTTNGLDFVTVHGSETLKPCIVNMGFFLNYAANSLTYSNNTAAISRGQKRSDKTLGADFSAGMGITDRWDFGINIPAVIDQSVSDNGYTASFDRGGITEIKANTKYRLLGDDNGGVAAILSVNINTIEDNPFFGRGAGPTWNFELAADTVVNNKWALAVNAGYRRREQGNPIAGVPFVPMDDQIIYGVAGSYLFSAIDSKLILELYGASAAKSVERGTERALTALEALLGLKHDYSRNMALHFGFTKQVDAALGGPDWRLYAGMNFAFGPICNDKPPEVVKVTEPPPPPPAEPVPDEVYTLNVELIFKHDSDQIGLSHIEPLDRFIQGLISQGFERIVIDGHTDSIGHPEYNIGLSVRRARRVLDYMVEKHKVDRKKLSSEGYGMSKPVADNGNFQGRQKNRRVEFRVWKDKPKAP